jgi:hypothetical protein
VTTLVVTEAQRRLACEACSLLPAPPENARLIVVGNLRILPLTPEDLTLTPEDIATMDDTTPPETPPLRHLRPVWIVTPHQSSEFDDWVGPAETEEHHQAALAYAKDRLEALWDQCEDGDSFEVLIERKMVEPGSVEYCSAYER